MNYIEERLANKFNKKYCCFTGSGTSAIYLILKALNMQNKKILYPAITCMAPVNAAIYAGYEPVFCDVNLKGYTMDLKALKVALKKYDVGIIVPTHIYGHKCDMESIIELAKQMGIFVLEDAAQTINITKAVDASIMSFGHTKILETQNGGGAVFTDNEDLYNKLEKEKKQLPKKPNDIDKFFDKYREKYYSIMKNKDKSINKYKAMLDLQLNSKNTFIYDMDSNEEIESKIKDIENIKNARNRRADLYENYLDNRFIDKASKDYEVLWRYSFLYKGSREELLKSAREKGIDISSWYPALYKFYSNQDKKYFPNADYIENSIVNLWVNPEYSEEKIKNIISVINDIFNKNRRNLWLT